MLDPSITLFGRKIKLKGNNNSNNDEEIKVDEFGCDNNQSTFDDQLEYEVDKEIIEEESLENDQEDDEYLAEAMDESTNASAMSETTNQTEKPIDSEKDSESHQDEKQSNDTKDSQQKLLKKPDKILPCPRCNSMDTKFCYYNNYNVNQPRHFCKSCQRYWTAGGTMRNVPVGAGRRKNKNSASRYCHVTMSEAIQAARFDVSNENLLTFGSDNKIIIPDNTVLNVATSSVEDRLKKREQGPTHQIPGFHQFPYMWNPAIPVPAPFCPAVFPMPISSIYPHPAAWNVPWVVPHCLPSQNILGSNSISPTLGKHTRDGEMVTPSTTSTTVLMPKTLRIDNPDEAAKSSIWSTLGIKKQDKSDSLSKGFFSNYQPKETGKKDGKIDDSSTFIKANPVALCRSFDFQERAN